MKFILSSLLTLLFCAGVHAQELSKQESCYINAFSSVIDKYLADIIQGENYVLFAISDRHCLVLVKRNKKYEEYYIDITNGILKSHMNKIKKKEKEIFGKLFSKNSYQEGFIDHSKYDMMTDGNPVYFYFCDSSNQKYGESLVTVFVKPTPIDSDIYYFLLQKIMSHL